MLLLLGESVCLIASCAVKGRFASPAVMGSSMPLLTLQPPLISEGARQTNWAPALSTQQSCKVFMSGS